MLSLHQAKDRKVVIERVAYHRNGICGNGFHVILFTQLDGTKMQGVVFEERGNVAVFDRELVGKGDIDFFSNSWRGDEFEQALREGVAEYQRAPEVLPAEKWAAGWSPLVDPIPDIEHNISGNADAATDLLSVIPKIAKSRKRHSNPPAQQ
jgi:hypothetical protein